MLDLMAQPLFDLQYKLTKNIIVEIKVKVDNFFLYKKLINESF